MYCPYILPSDNKSGKIEQWIGWVGLDKRLNIGLIEGNSIRDKRTLDQFSCESPSLTFHNGIMYVSWTGLDHRINIATFAGEVKLSAETNNREQDLTSGTTQFYRILQTLAHALLHTTTIST